jgi:hypothetical protein
MDGFDWIRRLGTPVLFEAPYALRPAPARTPTAKITGMNQNESRRRPESRSLGRWEGAEIMDGIRRRVAK